MTMPTPYRRCLQCDAVEFIAQGEAVWPAGWTCAACGSKVEQYEGIPMFAPALADTMRGFNPDTFDKLAKLEDEHFWFVARNLLIVSLAEKFFPNASRFLEVGCGTGFVLRAMAQSRNWERLVGSELHPTGLAHARRRLPAGVEMVQMDACDIPATQVFDLSGAFDVVEHILEDEAVLCGMRAATVTGGGIIVTVPQHSWLWSRADEVAHHQRRYSQGELEEKLRRNGYEIIFSSSFNALLLPLIAASRLLGKKATEDSAYEFQVHPTVNRILLGILRLEVSLTLAGLRWPVGGSRVVVGRAV